MKCKKCGREVKDGDIFCTFCGTRQVSEETEYVKEESVNSESSGSNSSSGVQIVIDKGILTNWLMRIGFCLLVCILYIVSKEEMFDIGGYYQLTVPELADMFKKAEFFLDESTFETLEFFCNCFSGSVLLYFAASAFVFFDKYGLAGFCIIVGFLGALLAVAGLWYCIMNVASEIGIDSIMQIARIPFWLYAGLNIVILGYSIKYI